MFTGLMLKSLAYNPGHFSLGHHASFQCWLSLRGLLRSSQHCAVGRWRECLLSMGSGQGMFVVTLGMGCPSILAKIVIPVVQCYPPLPIPGEVKNICHEAFKNKKRVFDDFL